MLTKDIFKDYLDDKIEKESKSMQRELMTN